MHGKLSVRIWRLFSFFAFLSLSNSEQFVKRYFYLFFLNCFSEHCESLYSLQSLRAQRVRTKQAARGDKIDVYTILLYVYRDYRYIYAHKDVLLDTSAIMLDFLDKTIELGQLFPATVLRLRLRRVGLDVQDRAIYFCFVLFVFLDTLLFGIRYKMAAP